MGKLEGECPTCGIPFTMQLTIKRKKDKKMSVVLKTFKEAYTKEDIRTMTPVQRIVLSYKTMIGIHELDKSWDKLYFSRFSKSAKQLLEFLGSETQVHQCMEEEGLFLSTKQLDWSLETIVKRATEWKQRGEKKCK